MGLFDLFKSEKRNWGASLYYNTQGSVGLYFGDRGSFTIDKTDAGTFEAMFLHAAMMNLLIQRAFPENGAQYWGEYMNELRKEMGYKNLDFKNITGIELNADFIQQRINYYFRRWVDLISGKEQYLNDVSWLIYSSPLCLDSIQTISNRNYAGDFFETAALSHYMISIYKDVGDDILKWKRDYR